MADADTATADTPATEAPKGTSLWKDAWLRLRKNKLAVTCACLLATITLLCVFQPLLSRHDSSAQDIVYGARPPSAEHWMGTDDKGRDLMVRVFEGGRLSLAVGLAATLVSLVIGVTYGSTAGYLGGRLDAFMMRVVDILYSIPFLIFVILLMVLFGRSIVLIFVAIGAVEWLTMARIVRGQIRSLKTQEFIEAAHALGLSTPRVIFRHLVPNVLGIVVVYSTLTVPAVMLLEAVLSFLGLGVQPPDASWGVLINEGANTMEVYPWLLVFPSLFFSLTLFSFNFLGDGLRDALDVRASKD
jgi:oligopeptide transport system permease protein